METGSVKALDEGLAFAAGGLDSYSWTGAVMRCDTSMTCCDWPQFFYGGVRLARLSG